MMITDSWLLGRIKNLLDSADARPTTGDLALVNRADLEALTRAHKVSTLCNEDAHNLQKLALAVREMQNASNPRPIIALLYAVTRRVMKDGGNPAFETSALVRVTLNTLLNILDHSKLPAYSNNTSLFHQDLDQLETLLRGPAA